MDPISNLSAAGTLHGSTAILIRLMDYLRKKNITGVFVNLVSGGAALEATDIGISSLMDTWLLARDVEVAGERNRVLYVLKARGMAHSNQLREFLITSKGIKLQPAHLGQGAVLTGSARRSQEAREKADAQELDVELERQRLAFSHRQAQVESEIARLRAGLAAEQQDLHRSVSMRTVLLKQSDADREAMGRSRSTYKGNQS
jgi:circadian clock protein KaiC